MGKSYLVIQRFLRHLTIKTTEAYLEVGFESMIRAVENPLESLFVKMTNYQKKFPLGKDANVLSRLKELTK